MSDLKKIIGVIVGYAILIAGGVMLILPLRALLAHCGALSKSGAPQLMLSTGELSAMALGGTCIALVGMVVMVLYQGNDSQCTSRRSLR